MIKHCWVILMGIVISCGPSVHQGSNDEHLPPDENRFERETFVQGLFEPTELVVMPDNRILFTQRRGGIKMYDVKREVYSDYDSIPVHFQFEDGLMGIALDPGFEYNRWVYLYYSPVGDIPKQHLSRFTFTESGLTDEIVVMEVATQRDQCCHTGGSIQFGGDGLLYLSTGDDTSPFASEGFSPSDERPGRSPWDAQKSSANTNDLRGKILRIKPEPDGTYSIPEGNLFEDDDPLTRPEIYVMGCRNPYRIAVDEKRGWLFWGDVGPDAREPRDNRGPQGHDEFNIAMEAGFYGWPLFVGDNYAYNEYDFQTGTSSPRFDPNKPINNSPNNTGRQQLPPAKPALVYYPYANSSVFPQLGNGSRNAMAGPVYYPENYAKDTRYPEFFEGRVFFYDWMRGWIFSLSLSEDGQIEDWYPFMPNEKFYNLIDMEFGPDGRLYILEYGTGWFSRNENASVTRINYIKGNRPPVLKATISRENGPAPLSVALDASSSFDYDGDELSFSWEIDGAKFDGSKLEYTFEKEGIYYPRITLYDQKRNKVTKQFAVSVGNSEPIINIGIAGNQTFFWNGRNLTYDVSVTDEEDGSLGAGISDASVDFNIQYFQSFDQAEILGHQSPVTSGEDLIQSLDCNACHQLSGASVGPSYFEVANRYENHQANVLYLINKVIDGGGGVWGEHVMAAHPELAEADAEKLIQYILSFRENAPTPLKGTYLVDQSEGRYYLKASYKDKGKGAMPSIERAEQKWLRSLTLSAVDFDNSNKVNVRERAGLNAWIEDVYNGSWVSYDDIDLTDIAGVSANFYRGINGGDVSIRIDGVEGEEIGKISVEPTEERNIKLETSLKETSGIHDLYFVFIDQESDNRLFTITQFEFIPKPNAK